ILNVVAGASDSDSPRYARGMTVSWYDQAAAPYRDSLLKRLRAQLARIPWLGRLFRRVSFPAWFEIFILSQLPFFSGGAGRAGFERLLRSHLRSDRLPLPPEATPFERIKAPTGELQEAAQKIVDLLGNSKTLTDIGRWPRLCRDITKIL